MSELIAIAYPNRETATDVVRNLARMQGERIIELEDVVAVTKDERGKVKLDQSVDLVSLGAVRGALWGSLIGMLFLAPLLGLLAGTAAGALGGKLSDYGIDDRFMKSLGSQLQPGGSAVIMLVTKATPDKALEDIQKFGGTVLRSSLSHDAEANLQAALQQHAGSAR
jgi:uncharacterized membrane protein